MKKYFLGLAAIVCAIAFSAFTKPFATYQFKLLTNPVVANIVNDDAQWSNAGTLYGRCDDVPSDIACTIALNTVETKYFHTVGSDKVLNTFAYANAQSPKQDYLEITEAIGATPDRIIQSITPKHFNTSTSQYETVSLGVNLSFANARD